MSKIKDVYYKEWCYQLERAQADPQLSDEPRVCCWLMLPTSSNDLVDPRYRFGTRCELAGAPITAEWGEMAACQPSWGVSHRCIGRWFDVELDDAPSTMTYAILEARATAWAHAEFDRLDGYVTCRRLRHEQASVEPPAEDVEDLEDVVPARV
jgi:hypothetical protein